MGEKHNKKQKSKRAWDDDGYEVVFEAVEAVEAAEASNVKARNRHHDSFGAMFASPVISIIVGSAKKEYRLHEDVLVQKTPYFASLLRSGLQEAQTRSVELSTEVDREDAFEKFIEYLYQKDYSEPEDIENASTLHARVHVLAERLCIDELKKISSQKLQNSLSKGYEEVSTWGSSDLQLGRKHRISAATMMQLASIIYTYTPELPQQSEISISEIDKPHSPENSQLGSGITGRSLDRGNSLADGRRIVSCFAASCWSSFRLDEKVKRFMDEHTDFAYDVLFRTGNGERLKPS